jgi:hypothetical protein
MRQFVHKAIGICFWVVLAGLWLDRHDNRTVRRFHLWAAMYPLLYWMLMLCITVVPTPATLLGRRGATSHLKTDRVAVEEEAVAHA